MHESQNKLNQLVRLMEAMSRKPETNALLIERPFNSSDNEIETLRIENELLSNENRTLKSKLFGKREIEGKNENQMPTELVNDQSKEPTFEVIEREILRLRQIQDSTEKLLNAQVGRAETQWEVSVDVKHLVDRLTKLERISSERLAREHHNFKHLSILERRCKELEAERQVLVDRVDHMNANMLTLTQRNNNISVSLIEYQAACDRLLVSCRSLENALSVKEQRYG